MKPHRSTASHPRGFTLLEVLVAITVLMILVGITAQLTNSAMIVSADSTKRISADAQARMVFDSMGNDFARIVLRKDVDYRFNKQSGNDSLFFYSEAPGYYSTSTLDATGSQRSGISLIGYRINSANQLERLGKGLTWTGDPTGTTPGSAKYLTSNGAADSLSNWWPAAGAAPADDPDFQVLSTGVYRLEVNFLLTDGTLSTSPWLASHSTVNGLADVSAIVVSIAILDDKSRAVVSNFTNMISALPDAVAGQSPAQTWANSSYLTTSQIPKEAASHLRIYQRFFFLSK